MKGPENELHVHEYVHVHVGESRNKKTTKNQLSRVMALFYMSCTKYVVNIHNVRKNVDSFVFGINKS